MDEALITLLEKKDLAYITVKEICQQANVNRSTFYLHYETIADLVSETVDMINERFLSYFPQYKETFPQRIHECEPKDLIFITQEYLLPYLHSFKIIKRYTAPHYGIHKVCRYMHNIVN